MITLLPIVAQAQSGSLYDNLGLYLAGGAALIVAIAAVVILLRLLETVVRAKEVQIYEKHGLEQFLGAKSSGASLWSKLYREATGTVPLAQEKDILLDHDYDGIKELDNNLPPWWVAMFYITIVWGVIYFVYYHMTSYGSTQEERYQEEMALAKASVDAYLATRGDLVDESTVTELTDAASLADGKLVYELNCLVCHLADGGGLVGPNLTDNYWIHGGSINDVFRVVKYGVPEKGMIAWSSQLRPLEMQKVSSYVLSLVGTTPANPKAPEGDLYISADSANDAVEIAESE